MGLITSTARSFTGVIPFRRFGSMCEKHDKILHVAGKFLPMAAIWDLAFRELPTLAVVQGRVLNDE